MDIERLKKQLKIDEGYSLKVYQDTCGNLTVGIGHLVLPTDNLHLGDVITKERSDKLFKEDLDRAVKGCKTIACFNKVPEDVQEVLVNMAFNLGVFGLKQFKKFLKALSLGDYRRAANEMYHSAWYRQTKSRAARLKDIVRSHIKWDWNSVM